MSAKLYVLKVVTVKVSTQSSHSITSPDENIRRLGVLGVF